MAGMRDFFDSPAGKGTAIVLVLIGMGWALFSIRGFGSSAQSLSNDDRVFVDSATGKSFRTDLKPGMKVPIHAPSGANTGYPAELCYWTADGKAKDTPTAVILNSWLGKPGPTFCPDCHRLVVGHNPHPAPGMKPPPTQSEYKENKEEDR